MVGERERERERERQKEREGEGEVREKAVFASQPAMQMKPVPPINLLS
jgi:hypothetical protein